MNKKILLLTILLLVSFSGFSQVRFMLGLSGSPNIAVGTFASQGGVSYGTYSPGFSIGGGVDVGLSLGKRFFILTGLERMNRKYSFQQSGYPVTFTEIDRSWEIPLLANFILSHDPESTVNCILTAGFIGGNINAVSDGTLTISSGISNPRYLDAALGVGAKINFNENLSLMLLPNIRYQLTNANYNTIYTASLRTMLIYTFGQR